MFDFDKSFAEFVLSNMKKQGLSAADAEEMMAELSAEWAMLPVSGLGGKSPAEYIDGIDDPAVLIGMMQRQAKKNGVLPLLYDRILKAEGTLPLLIEALDDPSPDVKIAALNLLTESGQVPLKKLALMLPDATQELAARITDALIGSADDIKDILLKQAESAGEDERKLYGEILSYCKTDGRVFDYLTRLFYDCGDVAFMCALLTRYGDDRAIIFLRGAAEDCGYIDFIELRSAIEALGGELETDKDWSDDEGYIKTKKI